MHKPAPQAFKPHRHLKKGDVIELETGLALVMAPMYDKDARVNQFMTLHIQPIKKTPEEPINNDDHAYLTSPLIGLVGLQRDERYRVDIKPIYVTPKQCLSKLNPDMVRCFGNMKETNLFDELGDIILAKAKRGELQLKKEDSVPSVPKPRKTSNVGSVMSYDVNMADMRKLDLLDPVIHKIVEDGIGGDKTAPRLRALFNLASTLNDPAAIEKMDAIILAGLKKSSLSIEEAFDAGLLSESEGLQELGITSMRGALIAARNSDAHMDPDNRNDVLNQPGRAIRLELVAAWNKFSQMVMDQNVALKRPDIQVKYPVLGSNAS